MERSLVELLLAESDRVIKKLKLDFNKELKRQFPDLMIEARKSFIKKEHQPYKKQLSEQRRKKWAKFKDRHRY